ncbi:MAG: OmpA family protein [Brachybacterium sp.]|uniref:OmpA family protein n=1 Tax=Brachybacterium sp. TaxID=1891286 RepID=UPI003242DC65
MRTAALHRSPAVRGSAARSVRAPHRAGPRPFGRLLSGAAALTLFALPYAPALAEGEIDEPPAQPFELGSTEPEEDEVIVLEADILFPSNAWDLSDGAAARIVELAAKIPEGATVQVGGHTDSLPVDRSQYDFDNQQLSENRAQAVADALTAERPDLTLEVTGHGDAKPAAAGGGGDDAGNAADRRVELRYGD